MLKTCCRSF